MQRQLGLPGFTGSILQKVQQEIDVKAGRLRNVLTLCPWPSSSSLVPLRGVLEQLEASRIVLRLDHRFEAYGQARLRIVLERLDRTLEGPPMEGMASLIPRSSSYPLPLGPAAQLGAGRFDTTVLQGDLRISRGAAPLNELRIFKRSVKRNGCSNWYDKLWNKESEARATLEKAGMSQYVLTENGARAVRISDGSAVWETWLDGSDVAVVLRHIQEKMPSACFAQLTAEGGLVEEKHPWLQDEMSREPAEKIFRQKVPDVVREIAKGCKCAKTYVHLPEAKDFAEAMKELKACVGEGWEIREIKQLLPKMQNCCEVQSSRVNKADGLRNLCEVAGIPLDQVWTFGDDLNDIRMLSEVGWGVRMANHLPALSGIGRDVTDFSNEEDGVAKYLEKHLLSASSLVHLSEMIFC
eukprot:symbB.v1.2.033056.t1/scaffold4047.1/size45603/2